MQLTPEQVNERLDKRGFLALEIPENLDLSTEIKRLKKKKMQYYWHTTIKTGLFRN